MRFRPVATAGQAPFPGTSPTRRNAPSDHLAAYQISRTSEAFTCEHLECGASPKRQFGTQITPKLRCSISDTVKGPVPYNSGVVNDSNSPPLNMPTNVGLL